MDDTVQGPGDQRASPPDCNSKGKKFSLICEVKHPGEALLRGYPQHVCKKK